jgi:hypothetical protein
MMWRLSPAVVQSAIERAGLEVVALGRMLAIALHRSSALQAKFHAAQLEHGVDLPIDDMAPFFGGLEEDDEADRSVEGATGSAGVRVPPTPPPVQRPATATAAAAAAAAAAATEPAARPLIRPLTLPVPGNTRWNSILINLRTLYRVRVATKHFIVEVYGPTGGDFALLLNDATWDDMLAAIRLLSPFLRATSSLSSQQTSTMAIALTTLIDLRCGLKNACETAFVDWPNAATYQLPPLAPVQQARVTEALAFIDDQWEAVLVISNTAPAANSTAPPASSTAAAVTNASAAAVQAEEECRAAVKALRKQEKTARASLKASETDEERQQHSTLLAELKQQISQAKTCDTLAEALSAEFSIRAHDHGFFNPLSTQGFLLHVGHYLHPATKNMLVDAGARRVFFEQLESVLVDRLLDQRIDEEWEPRATAVVPHQQPPGISHESPWMEELRKEAAAAAAAEKAARSATRQFDDARRAAKDAVRREMDTYADEEIHGSLEDVLQWWFRRRGKFPILYDFAKSVLGIPVGGAAAERIFSRAGLLCKDRRSSTGDKLLRACTKIRNNHPCALAWRAEAEQKTADLRKRRGELIESNAKRQRREQEDFARLQEQREREQRDFLEQDAERARQKRRTTLLGSDEED